ncbi:hypothetical protein CHARACLAT_006630 [Characodon lateralis]|uniref:Uncharacterized protein n=1 Tax=Characodon lateralis TaxID=208331 RepID=A0ABU7E7K1_9TELE|nr:hypothetical protein [Characodon lateralis]
MSTRRCLKKKRVFVCFFTCKGNDEELGIGAGTVGLKDLDIERRSPPLFGFTGSFTTSAIVLMFQVISCSTTKQVGCTEVTLDAAATLVRKQILKGYLTSTSFPQFHPLFLKPFFI